MLSIIAIVLYFVLFIGLLLAWYQWRLHTLRLRIGAHYILQRQHRWLTYLEDNELPRMWFVMSYDHYWRAPTRLFIRTYHEFPRRNPELISPDESQPWVSEWYKIRFSLTPINGATGSHGIVQLDYHRVLYTQLVPDHLPSEMVRLKP